VSGMRDVRAVWAKAGVSWRRGWDWHPRLRGISPTSGLLIHPRARIVADSIHRHGFLGGGLAFTGTAFGAAAFLGFFFSLLCELLPFPIVVTSIRD
jgi:hypothetical protein